MSRVTNNIFLPALPASDTRSGRRPARLTAAVLLAATAIVSGCASYSRDHVVVGSVPDDYRTRHPIIVSQSETTEDMIVSATARTLSMRDHDVVSNFASRFKRSGAAAMAILVPTGSRNEAAARRIADQIIPVLHERGISSNQILVQHYQASGHGDSATLRLVFSDMRAGLDHQCGQWNEDVVDTSENRNYETFGCATQQNLAAMIANPADLLGPRGESDIDSTRRTKVIEDWRENGSGTLAPLF
ncbi:MAG: CpaD family pilus assembly protein [Rhizobiaceae bacterium]